MKTMIDKEALAKAINDLLNEKQDVLSAESVEEGTPIFLIGFDSDGNLVKVSAS